MLIIQNLFKFKHFQIEIIILCIRWYLKYLLSYGMLVEIIHMIKKGLIDRKSQNVLFEIKFENEILGVTHILYIFLNNFNNLFSC